MQNVLKVQGATRASNHQQFPAVVLQRKTTVPPRKTQCFLAVNFFEANAVVARQRLDQDIGPLRETSRRLFKPEGEDLAEVRAIEAFRLRSLTGHDEPRLLKVGLSSYRQMIPLSPRPNRLKRGFMRVTGTSIPRTGCIWRRSSSNCRSAYERRNGHLHPRSSGSCDAVEILVANNLRSSPVSLTSDFPVNTLRSEGPEHLLDQIHLHQELFYVMTLGLIMTTDGIQFYVSVSGVF